MKRLVIGLAGYAGSGKDSFADQLEKSLASLGYKVMRAGFADPIRRMLSALGVPEPYMRDRELKEKKIPGLGFSYRHLAQTLGTEWGRHCMSEDFWLAVLRKSFEESDCTALIVTDVRFPDEAQWISLDMGGYLFRLQRAGVAPVRLHESEQYVAKMAVDQDIQNGGTLIELHERAHEIAIHIAQQEAQEANRQWHADVACGRQIIKNLVENR